MKGYKDQTPVKTDKRALASELQYTSPWFQWLMSVTLDCPDLVSSDYHLLHNTKKKKQTSWLRTSIAVMVATYLLMIHFFDKLG